MIVIRQKNLNIAFWCPTLQKVKAAMRNFSFSCRHLFLFNLSVFYLLMYVPLLLFASPPASSINFYKLFTCPAVFPPPDRVILWVILTGAVSYNPPSWPSNIYNSGRFVCLKVSRLERERLHRCVYCCGRERWRFHADCIFGSALKTKTGSPPSRHTTTTTKQLKKKKSRSLNLNWTCALGVRDCDGWIETEIKKKTTTKKNSFLFFCDIQKCFFVFFFHKWRRLFRKQPWESVSTSHRSCHAE